MIKPSSIVIQFLEGFLGNNFFDCAEMTEMKQVLSFSMNGIAIMGKTKEKIKHIMFEMLNAEKFGKLNGLIEIFGILSTSNELQPLSFDTISGINAFDSMKMNKVLEYILMHYKDKVSIQEAAQCANLSDSAFCRYFKSRTQKSFMSFIIEMRLNEAIRLLRESQMTILEICYASGFNNLSNFNRLFRKQYAQNPTEYRIRIEF